ncbi:hypothetical protein F5884DRAFT_884007 [Xylogone sp. PMI_703]|nr:hypothetical protein F5884DRAFT_884007 [Xylogone sp. PMI_703]
MEYKELLTGPKLKCDSSAPKLCSNCTKRGVECRYEEAGAAQDPQGRTVPSEHVTEAGIPRDRAQRACTHCAAQKLKCSGARDGCQRCAQNNLICQYLNSKRGVKRTASSRETSSRSSAPRQARYSETPNDQSLFDNQHSPVQDSEPDGDTQSGTTLVSRYNHLLQTRGLSYELPCAKDIIRRHIDAYFDYVYPITTHGFLHQGTLLEQLDGDRIPTVLLQAIAVCSSRFVASPNESAKHTARWADEVDGYIMRNIGIFSIFNLQIILLWVNHHNSQGNLGKTWMLLGMAARLAFCLQLNIEPKTGSPSQMECKRRIVWNIRILDRLLAGTVDEFSLCSRFMDSLQLPCDEHFYLADLPVETDTLEGFSKGTQIPNIGGFAGLVGLFEIWREILMFMKNVARHTEPETTRQQVFALQQKLSDFELRLPPNLKFVNRNLYLHASTAQKITFIILQSWWHECHCDLYRFSLPGFRESVVVTSENAAFIEHCQQQVLQSALAQSKFWRSVTDMGHVLVSDPTLVVLVHSNTKTLLATQKVKHMDGWDEDNTPGGATDIPALLESNVLFLDELAKRVPRVAIIKREIENIIQNTSVQGSSEAALNNGLPLKRRHSRQELLEKRRREELEIVNQLSENMRDHQAEIEQPICSNTMESSVNVGGSDMGTLVIASDDASSEISLSRSNTAVDIYLHTPVSLEEASLDNTGLLRLQMGEADGWRHLEFGQLQHFYAGQQTGNAQFLESYQGDFIGGTLGYFTPFEMMRQDDMLAMANYAEYEQ